MSTPTSEAAAEASPIHILWSDDGQHIRKWDWKSFDGATPYHPTPERGAVGRVKTTVSQTSPIIADYAECFLVAHVSKAGRIRAVTNRTWEAVAHD